jgi:hypothetical protein
MVLRAVGVVDEVVDRSTGAKATSLVIPTAVIRPSC